MIKNIVLLNGKIINSNLAQIPIDNIEFSYGFGVYETLKVRRGIIYFPDLHILRLIKSSNELGINLEQDNKLMLNYLTKLKEALNLPTYNIKIIVIGKENGKKSDIYMFATNPFFITNKEKKGVFTNTYFGERQIPNSKNLNMLISYLAYKKAKETKCYDSLLVNKENCITEGTRSNIIYTDGKQIFTPPQKQTLEGVTLKTIKDSIKIRNIQIYERPLKLNEVQGFSGYALTSTSINILPIIKINHINFELNPLIKEISEIYKQYLSSYSNQNKNKFVPYKKTTKTWFKEIKEKDI